MINAVVTSGLHTPNSKISSPRVDLEEGAPHHGPEQPHQHEGILLPGNLVCGFSCCLCRNCAGQCPHCGDHHLRVPPPHSHVHSPVEQICPGHCFFICHHSQIPTGSFIREENHLLQWLHGSDLFLPLCWWGRYFFPFCDGL